MCRLYVVACIGGTWLFGLIFGSGVFVGRRGFGVLLDAWRFRLCAWLLLSGC